MLSDVLIPLLDPRQSGQVEAYEKTLDRLDEAGKHVKVVVRGHGAVAEGPEAAARLAADRAYIDALRRGEDPVDARLDQDWLSSPHQSNVEMARRSGAARGRNYLAWCCSMIRLTVLWVVPRSRQLPDSCPRLDRRQSRPFVPSRSSMESPAW